MQAPNLQQSQRITCGLILILLLFSAACRPVSERSEPLEISDRPIDIVATTNIVADLVREIGGERVEVTALMGPGVDPHLYRASEGDVQAMVQADVIFYNGLHLEGKMTDIFEQMKERGMRAIAVAEGGLTEDQLIESEQYAGNYDPHVWFDVALWMDVARFVEEKLAALDSAHAAGYHERAEAYLAELDSLDAYVTRRAQQVPEEKRVLITSHDAFSYFGRAYEFDVRGLQGISTASEAGAADVMQLADLVVEHRIPALFVETSVSPQGIEAVREAVQAQGFGVELGGLLYGDALGNPGTPEGSYEGAVRHNIDTIVNVLRPNA